MRYHFTLVFDTITDLKHFTQAMELTELAIQIKKNEKEILEQQELIAKNENIIEKANLRPEPKPDDKYEDASITVTSNP